jgi:hypothetical protein
MSTSVRFLSPLVLDQRAVCMRKIGQEQTVRQFAVIAGARTYSRGGVGPPPRAARPHLCFPEPARHLSNSGGPEGWDRDRRASERLHAYML